MSPREADWEHMAATDVCFSGITKRYTRRGSWVLNGIDLELQPGSRTVIVGGNGSGKSTLLRIAAGLSRPNHGTVRLPDRIGYVPERLAARTRFTGAEYLGHMGRIRGLPAAVVRTRSRELLHRLDLRPGPDEPIDSLSKGNRQKLVVAQAFLAAVELLVLDEPSSGLDPVARVALSELTNEAQSNGTAVLLSSHRAVPRQPALRQLRIEDGHLEPSSDLDTDPEEHTRAMEVRLAATDGVAARQGLAAIPGVARARLEEPSGLVVLLTDHLQIDGVLLAAIAQGWSVRSVHEVAREDGRG
jgi:ABC-2 type transport system ATP-binding protein